MIGIYKDEFIDYLKKYLNPHIHITSKNIITQCPWCEYGEDKKHYHLYISLDNPIFNCFHADCHEHGFITKLINKIEGTSNTNKLKSFIDEKLLDEKVEKYKFNPKVLNNKIENNIILPKVDINQFSYKTLFLKKRFKFSTLIDIENLNGLIFDFYEFLKINKIQISREDKIYNLQDFIQTNFVGFLTNNKSYIIFRNIDMSSSFAHFKYVIYPNNKNDFLDYYKINNNLNGKYIVLAEGVYDIYSEYIFDFLKKRNDIILYACSASSNYLNLMKSIVFNEQIFKPNFLILSDNNIPIEYYKKIRKNNSYFINSLTVYYNKRGKDFNEMPILLDEFVT